MAASEGRPGEEMLDGSRLSGLTLTFIVVTNTSQLAECLRSVSEHSTKMVVVFFQ